MVRQDIIRLIKILSKGENNLIVIIYVDDMPYDSIEVYNDEGEESFRLVMWGEDGLETYTDSYDLYYEELLDIRNQLEQIF